MVNYWRKQKPTWRGFAWKSPLFWYSAVPGAARVRFPTTLPASGLREILPTSQGSHYGQGTEAALQTLTVRILYCWNESLGPFNEILLSEQQFGGIGDLLGLGHDFRDYAILSVDDVRNTTLSSVRPPGTSDCRIWFCDFHEFRAGIKNLGRRTVFHSESAFQRCSRYSWSFHLCRESTKLNFWLRNLYLTFIKYSH